MKVFSVFFAILLHSLLGDEIACPLGSRGPQCAEKCAKNCKNLGVCTWKNETEEYCACDEKSYTGEYCEIELPCANVKCPNGKCVASNSTLISSTCICNNGYKGDRCDEAIIDGCLGQTKLGCKNDASCADNKCVCKDGFVGGKCERIVPLLSEYESSRCDPKCVALFDDNNCDEECNTAECFYDGHDCSDLPDDDFTWYDLETVNCLVRYGNDVCDKDCETYNYGFDGGDCEKELRGTKKISKIQLSLGANPTTLNLSQKYLIGFLAQILRASVSISKRDNQQEVFAVRRDTGAEERIALDDSLLDRYTNFTKLIIDVDSSHCKDNRCLRLNGTDRTIEPLITLLRTMFIRVDKPLSFQARSTMERVTLLDVVIAEDPSPAWIDIFLAVIISMLLTLILAVCCIVCWLGRRRHRQSKTAKDGGGAGLRNRWIDNQKNRLVAAVEAGNVSSLTALLSEMTPVEAANAEDVAGNTVLHMAAARDDKQVVQLLLHSRMFDVCSVNSVGQSPLLYSLREGKPSLETLTLLVNAINDTKMHARTTGPISHLMLTALSEEAGWGLTDAVGRSALHHAALAGRPRHIIHFLVSHGSSPGLQDASGNTPLHLAAINGHTDTVHALLDERAAVTVTNSLGNTPAQVCHLNGHANLAALLFEKEEAVTAHDPTRPRHDSLRTTMYSTHESLFSDEPDELVLPSLLSFRDPEMGVAAPPLLGSSSPAADVIYSPNGGGRLSFLGSALSGSTDGLLSTLTTTPTPKLPHILTPSSQLVEGSPELLLQEKTPGTTLPRKCLYGVERSPSDPRPSQLTTPYVTYGKRRSLPDGPSLTPNYRDALLLSPAHYTYASNTMSSTSERSQTGSMGQDSNVSSFRPPPLS